MKRDRIWFITDIHGSVICFRKFINSWKSKKAPSVCILGGDITGKYIIPIVKRKDKWEAAFEGEKMTFTVGPEVTRFSDYLQNKGAYPYECTVEELRELKNNADIREELLHELQLKRIEEWVCYADKQLEKTGVLVIINAGNDDPFLVDEVLGSSKRMVFAEGKVLEITEHLSMISTGFANRTPWNCPRDLDEKELGAKIDLMAQNVRDFRRCLFNLHCPPFDSHLDQAPKLDSELRPTMNSFGVEFESVGSKAVRESILKYQPLIGLHGHIHEQHCYEWLGKTLCFNPGSSYMEGMLNGVYLEFEGSSCKRFFLTREGG